MMLFMLPPLYVCVCSEIPHLSPYIMIPISITFASELYSVLLEKKEIINDKVPIFFFKFKNSFHNSLPSIHPPPSGEKKLWQTH